MKSTRRYTVTYSEFSLAYLEYLRNLTPQGLLFLMALVMAFLSGRAIGSGKQGTFVALEILCFLAGLVACVANTQQFLRKVSSPLDLLLKRYKRSFAWRGHTMWKSNFLSSWALVKRRPVAFGVVLLSAVLAFLVPILVFGLAVINSGSIAGQLQQHVA